MRLPPRNHLLVFKAKVALGAVEGDQTLVQSAEQYAVHPNQVTQWKTELLKRAAEFLAPAAEKCEQGPDVKTSHAMIGQLTLENDFVRAVRCIGAARANDDRSDVPTADHVPGAVARPVAFFGVLLAASADLAGGSGADATHGRATSEPSRVDAVRSAAPEDLSWVASVSQC